MLSSVMSRDGNARESARSIESRICLCRRESNIGGDIDGPERAGGPGGTAGRWIVGEDCTLRGVALRWSGGDLELASCEWALPMDEALCIPGSMEAGYLAYCWMTMGEAPSSFRSGWLITVGKVLCIANSDPAKDEDVGAWY